MKASLVMFKPDGSRRDFPLKNGSIVIGRKNTCEMRIPLSSVSRQHCEITLDDGKIKLRDLGSSNGTYHNSIRVQEAELEAGDELVVGPVVFTVVVDGEPESIEPIRTVLGDESADVLSGGMAEDPMASDLPEDSTTPTVDLDEDDSDDPFAALEAMGDDDSSGLPAPAKSATPDADGSGLGDSSIDIASLDELDTSGSGGFDIELLGNSGAPAASDPPEPSVGEDIDESSNGEFELLSGPAAVSDPDPPAEQIDPMDLEDSGLDLGSIGSSLGHDDLDIELLSGEADASEAKETAKVDETKNKDADESSILDFDFDDLDLDKD